MALQTDVYELGFDVDSRGLKTAKLQLKKVGDEALSTGYDAERFQKKSSRAFKKAGTDAERMRNRASRAFRGMAGAFTGLIGAYAAFGAVRGIVRTTAEFENFNTTLTTITGSARGAADAFDLVQKFAKETPFQLREVLAMFVRLKNAGLEPTAELLQTITDTASVTMDPTRAWEIITKVIARGTAGPLQLEDLEMLQNLGLGYVPIFQKKLGLDRQEIAEFTQEAENGKLAVQALLEGFQEMYGGAGLRKMDSLTGTWSNLNDQISKVQAAVGEGMRRELVTTSTEMQDMLRDNREGFEQLGVELGEMINFFNDLLRLAAENPEEAGWLGKALFGTVALWAGTGMIGGILRNIIAVGKFLKVGAGAAAVAGAAPAVGAGAVAGGAAVGAGSAALSFWEIMRDPKLRASAARNQTLADSVVPLRMSASGNDQNTPLRMTLGPPDHFEFTKTLYDAIRSAKNPGGLTEGLGGTDLITAGQYRADVDIFKDQLDSATTEMWRSLVDGSKDTLAAFKEWKREMRNEFKVEALERLFSRPFKKVMGKLMDDLLNELVGDGFGSDKIGAKQGLVGRGIDLLTFHSGGVVPGQRRNSGGSDGMGGVLINAKPGEIVIDPERTKIKMRDGGGSRRVKIDLNVERSMEVQVQESTDSQGDYIKVAVTNTILNDLARDGDISRGLRLAGGLRPPAFAGA